MICTRCGKNESAPEFRLCDHCRAMSRAFKARNREKIHAWNRSYIMKNKERNRVRRVTMRQRHKDPTKTCTQCHEMKPVAEFALSTGYLHSRCRSCRSTAPHSPATYPYLTNKRFNGFDRGDGTVTRERLERLWKNSTSCAYCGIALSNVRREIDHVVPLGRSGKHTISNLVVACVPCNRKKKLQLWSPRPEAYRIGYNAPM